MANQKIYLQYQINLIDKAYVEQLQGVVHDGGAMNAVIKSPLQSAIDYKQTGPQLGIVYKDEVFSAPSLTSEWFGTTTNHGNNYPLDQKFFQRKSGGWFGWPFLFGTTKDYYWRGLFVYAGPTTANTGVPGEVPSTIPQRRWINGFEMPRNGEGGASSAGNLIASRMASRHLGGFGLGLRNQTAAVDHIHTTFGQDVGYRAWERFYVRIRKNPTGAHMLWHVGGVSPLAGAIIDVLASGQLQISNRDNGGTIFILTVLPALVTHRWYKIDLLYRYGNAGANRPTTFNVYINGVENVVTGFGTTGLGATTTAMTSSMGAPTGPTNGLGVDIDDWIGADWPAFLLDKYPDNTATPPTVPAIPPSLDWIQGSHVMWVPPVAFAATHNAAWIGDYALAAQRPIALAGNLNLTCSTALAKMAVVIDGKYRADFARAARGYVALAIGKNGSRAGVTDGRLGYRLPPAADVLTTITETTGVSWNTVMYRPSGLTTGIKMNVAGAGDIEAVYEKANVGTLASVQALQVSAEVIGIFGSEDEVLNGTAVVESQPEEIDVHNAPYPRTSWATKGVPQSAGITIYAGTYVGDGVFKELTFTAPIHWLWIRPLSGLAGGVQWWSSMNGAHIGGNEVVSPDSVTIVEIDTSFVGTGLEDGSEQRTRVRMPGTNTQSNAAGVTYQYVAISDPMMRFLMCGTLWQLQGATDYVNGLENAKFTPEAAFFQREVHESGSASGTTYFKGITAGSNVQPLSTSEIASALDFGLATMTSKSAFHLNGHQMAYAAFRRADGLNDAGQARVLALVSYTGDGAASRTITYAPASGRRPLWAIVVPHNGAATYRDPSHTGTTSTLFPSTAVASLGISGGGIDSITVGSNLNSNGIVFDVFVIPGEVAAGNGGWSIQPTDPLFPVDPQPPYAPAGEACDPWCPEPGDPNSLGNEGGVVDPGLGDPGEGAPGGGIDLGGVGADFGATCIVSSTAFINTALSKIGVSKRIGSDITTELTAEAAAGRLHFAEDASQVLRDFPWPFATKYATLTLVAGSVGVPVNADWIYSYRRPTDCIFERRIVVVREGSVDATPPPFQLSSDATGGLIFTNQAAAVLEYTFRPDCPARMGDPLYRECLIWKLAGTLAATLSRMSTIVDFCLSQYKTSLAKADLIIRPGNPGAPSAAVTVDVSAPAQAANVSVVNHALIRIGARTIRNLQTDQSIGAQAAKLIFEEELRAVLRDFPWAFATKYGTLAGSVGTRLVPANDDWIFNYLAPTDLVAARRVVNTATGRGYDPSPPTFRLGFGASALVVYTNEEDAVLEYTSRLEGAVLFSDSFFKDALAWRLAAALAPSLAQINPAEAEQWGRGPDPKQVDPNRVTMQLRAQATRFAMQMYLGVLDQARAANAGEQQQEPPGDADWISGRN